VIPLETQSRADRAWAALARVPDPEIPVLSVIDLGIVRQVAVRADDVLEVGLSPTYSGCPASEVIRASVERALTDAGLQPLQIVKVLSPAWSSAWITPAGRAKLHAYGIAPPSHPAAHPKQLLRGDRPIACPRCGSSDTECISEFGSTPCKALHRCHACLEPFDYFKCI
jgi:ring-1,2-phenylacetyl-CoA epoxidase subunit PaaD